MDKWRLYPSGYFWIEYDDMNCETFEARFYHGDKRWIVAIFDGVARIPAWWEIT